MKHARRIKARISVPILGRPRLRDRQQLGDKLGTRRAHPVEKDANEAATRNHRAGLRLSTRSPTDTRRDPPTGSYGDLSRQQRPQVSHLSPRKCPQTAAYLAETAGRTRTSNQTVMSQRFRRRKQRAFPSR
jgi:hypothetical protein